MTKLVGGYGRRSSAMLSRFEYSEWYEQFALTPTTMDNGNTIWLKNYYWRLCEMEHTSGGYHIIEEKCANVFEMLQK
jgi:hypothetical protein